MNDVHHRIDNAIRRYQSALLNDTKWREILQVVGKVGMPIQFSFVREEDFKVLVFFPEDGCLANMTRDCAHP